MSSINTKKFIDKTVSFSFISTVVICGVLSASGLKLNSKELSTPDLLSGHTAQAIEGRYDNQFAFKELGTNTWGAIEYTLFREGRQGVVIGDNGWLFTSEEFQSSPHPQQAIEQNLAYVKWVNLELSAKNIRLLVVPVPSKARLYQKNTGRKKPDPVHYSLYRQLIRELSIADVAVSDSLAAMEQQLGSSPPLFLRTDTHWSPEGAHLVASYTAANLQDWFVEIELHKNTFTTEKVGKKIHRGDLTRFLPLAPWFDQLLPEVDHLNLYRTYSTTNSTTGTTTDTSGEESLDNLFADSESALDSPVSIALVGTSYSANSDWNFDGSLKQCLGTDLANFAEQGDGPLIPMVKFLNQHIHTLPDLKLVIWEIPERYLLNPYPQAYAAMEIHDHSNPVAATNFSFSTSNH